ERAGTTAAVPSHDRQESSRQRVAASNHPLARGGEKLRLETASGKADGAGGLRAARQSGELTAVHVMAVVVTREARSAVGGEAGCAAMRGPERAAASGVERAAASGAGRAVMRAAGRAVVN